jgi:hypothetical protein
LPCTQVATSGALGSNHAPVDSCTTPGATSADGTSPARALPILLSTSTTSPAARPRPAASAGCIRSGSRPAIFASALPAPWSSWLCSLVAGLFATRKSGNRPVPGGSARSSGSSHDGWPGQSSYPKDPTTAEAISIRPLGVGSACATGSTRKSA